MLKINATELESYRRFLTSDFQTQAEFLQMLRQGFQGNELTELGTQFHDLLQNPELTSDIFPIEAIKEGRSLINYSFPFEVPIRKIYDVGEEVIISCKADQLIGDEINEFKTKWSTFKYEGYHDSIQWRIYLDVFEADIINYSIFEFYRGAKGIVYKGLHTPSFNRYSRLEIDIMVLLQDYVEFINKNDLRDIYELED